MNVTDRTMLLEGDVYGGVHYNVMNYRFPVSYMGRVIGNPHEYVAVHHSFKRFISFQK
jgi:hypothetical protein